MDHWQPPDHLFRFSCGKSADALFRPKRFLDFCTSTRACHKSNTRLQNASALSSAEKSANSDPLWSRAKKVLHIAMKEPHTPEFVRQPFKRTRGQSTKKITTLPAYAELFLQKKEYPLVTSGRWITRFYDAQFLGQCWFKENLVGY